MNKKSCKVALRIDKNDKKVLKNLLKKTSIFFDFIPYKMDFFSFENANGVFQHSFDFEYILNNLTIDFKKGIHSISIYDKEYSDVNVTPFFRFEIKRTNDKNLICLMHWVGYYSFSNIFLNYNLFKTILVKSTDLLYCYIYNPTDVFNQNNKKSSFKKNWGRSEEVNHFYFLAAPTMYFGEGSYEIIDKELMLSLSASNEININSKKILRILLFDFEYYNNERLIRSKQKEFWVRTNLKKQIEVYREKCQVSVFSILKQKGKVK